MEQPRKILVVGSGGREHALAMRLLESPSVTEVLVAPGNAGTEHAPAHLRPKVLRNVVGAPRDIACAERVDLVVVGPEAPLCDGLADELTAQGIAVFGPSRSAARLEGSKSFMKDFAMRHGIKTAAFRVVRDASELERALQDFPEPPVVKADGLCAGKGVILAKTHDEARAAARAMLSGNAFGEAGRIVVLEERLEGSEASVHAIADGERIIVLPAAQDHKRIGEGDTGPNTGGMGTYAPAPLIDERLRERIEREMLEPTVKGLAQEGMPYRGALFAGIMVDAAGEPYLLEYNVRFGDPETQVLMAVLEGDFAEALHAAARGALRPGVLTASAEHALCVVLAASGYPGSVRRGDAIEGLAAAEAVQGVRVYHAGTARQGDAVVTAGGRVLGVTGRGSTLSEARERAYRAADLIAYSGKQLRRDIGHRVLGRPA
jgi:phosphoribosylamine--glycine ligase